MASRREQKEQLRQEREQREAEAASSARRNRLLGYLAGAAIVVVAVVAAVALLAGGDGGAADDGPSIYPAGGSVPALGDSGDLAAAAAAAGCELRSFRATSRRHLTDLSQTVRYSSRPPTSGAHYQEWAEDRAYSDPPDVKMLVHTLEHGRVIVWFKRNLPPDARASLKAYYDSDPYQMVLVPDETGMPYAVAATAWNRDPQPNGTGRLLGCPKFDDRVFTALEAFKDEHRGRGPEAIP